MEEKNYLLNIDVLGFGDFVSSNELSVVNSYYTHLITGSAFSGEIIDKDSIEIMVYSDTIAIKSNQKDKNKCLYDLVRIANMIQTGTYYSALSVKSVLLPVRGTITFGDFVFHKGEIWTQAMGRPKIYAKDINLIFGKPIVESYHFEKSMEIICIAITDSVLQEKNDFILEQLLKENLLIDYNIPLKQGKYKNGFIVNPVLTPHFKYNFEKLEYEKQKYKDEKGIYDKYVNTQDLFTYINKNELFFPNIKDLKEN